MVDSEDNIRKPIWRYLPKASKNQEYPQSEHEVSGSVIELSTSRRRNRMLTSALW